MADDNDDIIQDDNLPDSDDFEENGAEDAARPGKSGNSLLRRMMDTNFIEYASYVIKERAIPDVDDGFKPVQRRILWSLFEMDDGKFHKVANVIGHSMRYHPHGDASIGAALVVLANKEYYIDKQGNFGNILTGDEASAARYIECRLSTLAKEVLFNNDITEFIDSYDGRNKEPIRLPAKVPSLLMIGTEGIAVGMSTRILPHNFKELLEAQIAVLKGEEFELYPDFLQGGMIDVREYEDGNGKVRIRSKIERDGRKLIIREIPYGTTTESVIASIEKAVARNKIKIANINDFTTDQIEIEITPMRGYDPDRALNALYSYTDCSVSVSVNGMVIRENTPVQMTVDEIIRRNTDKLLEYLRAELEIELGKLEDKFHDKTLERIFIENRIYKRIEECETNEKVHSEVREGLKPFLKELKREVTDEDIQRLLAIPIRRISLFDINKNKDEIEEILKKIDEVNKHLKRLKAFAIKHLQALIDKYGDLFPRRTEIEKFDAIDKRQIALDNIKVGWDRKNGYIGTSVRSDEQVTCNEFDHLLCIERSGKYKVVNIPDRVYIGRLFYFAKYDKTTEYAIVYREKKSGKCYYKRCVIDKFITDREYALCPKGCKLEIITTRLNSIYECSLKTRLKAGKTLVVNLMDAPQRGARARGLLINAKPVVSFKFLGLDGDDDDDNGGETGEEEETKTQNEASDENGKSEDKKSNDQTGDEKDGGNESKTIDSATTLEESEKDDPPVPSESKKKSKSKSTPSDDEQASKQSDGDKSMKTDEDETIAKTEASSPDKPKKKGRKKKNTSGDPLPGMESEESPTEEKPKRKPRKTTKKKTEKPTEAKPSDETETTDDEKPDDDDDDLGISQPEFGF